MSKVSSHFEAAMKEAYRSAGFSSYRQASVKTGIDHALIFRMLRGELPGVKTVIKWANGIGEPVNKWLVLAGHDPLKNDVMPNSGETSTGDASTNPRIESIQSPKTPATTNPNDIRFVQPEIPQSVAAMIDAAETNDDKINVAFNYLKSLPDIRFGADRAEGRAARIAIIRTYEKYTGIVLLGPEVI